MIVSNPFFNTQTTISDVDQLTDRLLALSEKDTKLISDILSLTENDTSMLTTINQQATAITQQSNDIAKLKTDLSTTHALANASSENLLINPRGKINQANELDGVLAAGVYFCDGWKAGANGAEVYRDADGFRLVSGSIIQLVLNNVEPNQTLRGNLTTVSGAPQIKINGGTDSAQSNGAEYIQFEVSGDNSKFTTLVLAESEELPIYRQQADELSPCKLFYRRETKSISDYVNNGQVLFKYALKGVSFPEMARTPAVEILQVKGYNIGSGVDITDKCSVVAVYEGSFLMKVLNSVDFCSAFDWIEYVVDGRL
ncbi:hypothetical protein [Vibrio europaeus]|uniref:hypothetical protein n=1 Tax=Vibrio europaeus TaxID=300876 RepID=UPI00233F71BA|nr:hypothetical protein [Vibrio europaeus]MDC5719434.1 hypothetical protein [Vibrio europaeus]MDC5720970.1 hypothetical protein [Vibrio europaeus]